MNEVFNLLVEKHKNGELAEIRPDDSPSVLASRQMCYILTQVTVDFLALVVAKCEISKAYGNVLEPTSTLEVIKNMQSLIGDLPTAEILMLAIMGDGGFKFDKQNFVIMDR